MKWTNGWCVSKRRNNICVRSKVGVVKSAPSGLPSLCGDGGRATAQGRGEKSNRLSRDNRGGTPGRIISRENYGLIHGWLVSLSSTLKCLQHWYLLSHDVIRPRCNTKSFCSHLHSNTHHIYRCNNKMQIAAQCLPAVFAPRSCDMTRVKLRGKLTVKYLLWCDDGSDVD